jgi:ATP-dependent protease ClpP protease subunit
MSVGSADDMRTYADTLEFQSSSIAAIYGERAGEADGSRFAELMAAETWFTPQDAVDAGLADVVVTPEKPARMPEKVDEKVVASSAWEAEFAASIINQEIRI